jgi:hypothetical protein
MPAAAGSDRGPMGHDDRHDLAVASLLDPDLPAEERAVAEGLVATCARCAALHADLAALAAAARGLAAVPRPRDFRLTADDAARLRPAAPAVGEPRAAATRLTGEMQVPRADHHSHDQLLVASLLDRSTDERDRERGEVLVATCSECAALQRDLVALRDATRALPVPPRTRDYAIASEDARRLRRGGWRRLVALFGSTRDALTKPLAVSLTTIGLAGLLLANAPGLSFGGGATSGSPTIGQAVGGAGSGTTSESYGGAREAPLASAAPSAATSGAPAAALALPASAPPSGGPERAAPSAEPVPSGEAFDTLVGGPSASLGGAGIVPAPNAATGQTSDSHRDAASSLAPESPVVDRGQVVIVAGVLFLAGIGLFGLRWAGRRV